MAFFLDGTTLKKTGDMYYFAYGANLNKINITERCGVGCIPIVSGSLVDHKLVLRNYLDVEEIKGEHVRGAIYKIDQYGLDQLDMYEGFPDFYQRKTIEVVGDDGKFYDCIVYYMNHIADDSHTSTLYIMSVREGYHHWKLPIRQLMRTLDERRPSNRFE